MATTWTHRIARAVVTPLIGTGVTPNHLTMLRLVTGLAACVAVALGTSTGALWGGSLWLLSAFLDRADGELARVGDMMSAKGHAFDYTCDALINTLIFLAAGIGARHTWLGDYALPFGLLATTSMAVCWIAGEAYQRLTPQGVKAYPSKWGFDLDDGLYLLAPLIWLQLMSYVVVAAGVVTLVMAVVITARLARLRARLGRTSA
jgi:archaetidylinositol phosphate synthase